MATGNRRRRLLRRKQKARELKARCQRHVTREFISPEEMQWRFSLAPLTYQVMREMGYDV